MRKQILYALPVLCAAFLFAGCQSDQYYQDRAVSKARKFLLENSPELTQQQIYHVTYNAPVLLTAPILKASDGSLMELSSNQQQICITWQIPGGEYLYMVFGTSTSRMLEWSPNRLIRKRFVNLGVPLDAAVGIARGYMTNYLYDDLSVAEYNMIRFTYPWVIETNFPLTANPEGKLSPEEAGQEMTKLTAQTQLSLVWKFPGGEGSCMVFCGTSAPDLSGWKINFAGRFPKTELDEVTRRILKTPDEANSPIVPALPAAGSANANEVTEK